jgi:hypothetical protein
MKTQKINRSMPVVILGLIAIIVALVAFYVGNLAVLQKRTDRILAEQQTEQVYHWKMVTTWPKKLSRPWHLCGVVSAVGR